LQAQLSSFDGLSFGSLKVVSARVQPSWSSGSWSVLRL